MRGRRKTTLRVLLDRKEIHRFKPATESMIKELDGALYDLDAANVNLSNRGYKWATIQASHSMLHAARALLNRMGYRAQGHNALLEALHQLYEREIIDEMLEDLSKIMTLTDQLHNGRIGSEDSARTTLEKATDFIEQAARILAAPREWFERPAPRPSRAKKC